MPHRRRAPRRARRLRATVPALVVATAALIGFVGERSPGTSAGGTGATATPTAPAGPPASGLPDRLPRDQRGALGAADGVVPDGVTVFDGGYAAVTRLDPALLAALRRAATDAGRVGVRLYVDSGWRSARYQEELLRRAIAKYGSSEEAARWVAMPDTSAHVSGDAVDIGHAAARAWLSTHGASYGLCRIYRNEPWHYELRPAAVHGGCPRMYADATDDPRLQPSGPS